MNDTPRDVFLDCRSQLEINQRIGDYLIRLKTVGILVKQIGKIKIDPVDGITFCDWIFQLETSRYGY